MNKAYQLITWTSSKASYLKRAWLWLIFSVILVSCGQKGDLYLPSEFDTNRLDASRLDTNHKKSNTYMQQ